MVSSNVSYSCHYVTFTLEANTSPVNKEIFSIKKKVFLCSQIDSFYKCNLFGRFHVIIGWKFFGPDDVVTANMLQVGGEKI